MTQLQPPSSACDADALIGFLSDRDVPCPLCRYKLRGLTTPRCPECGRELQLTVGLTEPRQGAWVLCQIAVAATGGIGLLALISIIQHGWPGYMDNPMLFNLCFGYYLASIPLTVAVFLLRRRYLRMTREKQWTIAIIACVATAASIIGMFAAGG